MRELKYVDVDFLAGGNRRIPHGMRGLKFKNELKVITDVLVASRMGCVD